MVPIAELANFSQSLPLFREKGPYHLDRLFARFGRVTMDRGVEFFYGKADGIQSCLAEIDCKVEKSVCGPVVG